MSGGARGIGKAKFGSRGGRKGWRSGGIWGELGSRGEVTAQPWCSHGAVTAQSRRIHGGHERKSSGGHGRHETRGRLREGGATEGPGAEADAAGRGARGGRAGTDLIVQVARLRDVPGLERDLEAAHAHAEGHAVHVDHLPAGDVPVEARDLDRLEVGRVGRAVGEGARVDEEGDADVDALAAALADVGGEGGEAGVGVDEAVGAVGGGGDGARGVARRGGRVGGVRQAHEGEGGDGGGDLARAEGAQEAAAAEAHALLHAAQVADVAAEGHSRSALHHPGAVLGVPGAGLLAIVAAPMLFFLAEELRQYLGASERQLYGFIL